MRAQIFAFRLAPLIQFICNFQSSRGQNKHTTEKCCKKKETKIDYFAALRLQELSAKMQWSSVL